MGVWLAGEDEVGMVLKYLLTERLMAVQVVAQESDAPCRVMRPPVKKPALAGGQFAILLGMAILRLDELGCQGNDAILAWRHQHRRDGDVTVQCLANGKTVAADVFLTQGAGIQ